MEQIAKRTYHSSIRNQRKQAILDFIAAFIKRMPIGLR